MSFESELIQALSTNMPSVLRWAGAVAKRLRHFDIALSSKKSGSANTDALTIADLTVQQIVVDALRDADPALRRCKIEAEESTGDLAQFATESDYTIALDPIDGTKSYRDRVGGGYAVMLHLRSIETVLYSLVFIPETGTHGTWVEVKGSEIRCGEDDPRRPALDVIQSLRPIDAKTRPRSKGIYLIGFQDLDRARAADVTALGLEGVVNDDLPGAIYELQSRGKYAGSLIHSPNVYDFPVSLHIARMLGGDAVWVHNRQSVHFREKWIDERADMLRLPGIVACSDDREILKQLCELAKDWNPERYTKV